MFRDFKKLSTWLYIAAVLLGACGLAVLVPPMLPVGPNGGTGWVSAPDEVQRIIATLPVKQFSDTPAYHAVQESGDVFLWDAAEKVTGSVLPAKNQGSVGSCVGHGFASGVEYLQCAEIASGDKLTYKPITPEVIYGGSRVQIGGGRIRGDGSVGAWAAKWLQQYGAVAAERVLDWDFTQYSESRCRQLGRDGIAPKLQELARQSPVQDVTLCASISEAHRAIKNGYPVAVCSDQGFSDTRDSDGVCRPRGTWMHCMVFIGERGGNRPGLYCLNSWGVYLRGPVVPANAPKAGFWVDDDVADRMLRQRDSWALAGAKGFPAKRVKWDH